jgi:uncharacterized protein (TIGR03435 family)
VRRGRSDLRSPVTLGVVVLSFGVGVGAQAPPTQQPADVTFEVASVKPNESGSVAQSVRLAPGDTFSATNVPLRTLIQMASGLPDRRIVGGPRWIEDRFDILAKAAAPATTQELRIMLLALLRDRFRLVTHSETREEPAYTLVHGRRDRRLGPNLRETTTDCATPTARAALGAAGPDHPCNPRLGIGSVGGRGLSISQLASMLSSQAGGTVTDKTGLSGNFDWDLTFTPPSFLSGPFDRERFPSVDPDGPSIFTAVEEQLGLTLEASRAEVEVLVIDSVEPPTPN